MYDPDECKYNLVKVTQKSSSQKLQILYVFPLKIFRNHELKNILTY